MRFLKIDPVWFITEITQINFGEKPAQGVVQSRQISVSETSWWAKLWNVFFHLPSYSLKCSSLPENFPKPVIACFCHDLGCRISYFFICVNVVNVPFHIISSIQNISKLLMGLGRNVPNLCSNFFAQFIALLRWWINCVTRRGVWINK